MALQVVLLVLPNVGKSTTFHCLSNAKAQAGKLSFLYNRTECRCNHRTR